MTSYDEIQAQIKQLQKQADAIKLAEMDSVVKDIKAKIAHYGLTAEQLGLGKRGGKKPASNKEAVVMYRNGDLTWSGSTRGRKPLWIKAIQEAKGDIEIYRVK